MPARRTKAGGAKKRPTRYAAVPETPEDLAVALRAHRKGQWREARDAYRARLARAPDCLDGWMNLGALLVLAGRAHEAAAAFERARGLAPKDGRVYKDAAIGFAAIGRLQDARDTFVRAIALDPTMVGAYLGVCRVCAELGDRDSALRYARQATELAPDDPSTHLELHRVSFDDRALGPCIEAAQRAVELDPAYALARLFLGGALALDGRTDEAEAALGPRGFVAPGLADALAFAVAQRPDGARYFACKFDGLRYAADHARLPGPTLEFGVRHGVSTRMLAQQLAGELHAFDSFQGLPEAWQGRDAGAFSTGGELPDVPSNVVLHVGWFEATLPAFVAQLRCPPRLIHIDSDLYTSARFVLDALGPWVVPGCILIFDQLIGNATWREDELRAFGEASAAFGWKHRPLALSWITGQAVIELVAS